MQTLFTIGVLVVVAAVAAAIWWRSQRKAAASRENHWFKAFAAERGGTFGSGMPSFGVFHPTGRPLTGAPDDPWVEFRLGDRPVLGIDTRESYRHFDDHVYFRDLHVTQVRVPPGPELRIVPGRPVSMPTLPPDSALDAEVARWLAANPRFGQREVVVENGSARTWGPGCATRQSLTTEAQYLADLADHLPPALWRVSGGAS
ncbi:MULTISPECIES: hypothetical protein [Amycolatopsis]|uniref:Secreted protein n=1 Tax=Amycolatopsis bullii TaxID=941987 RepID=A0ABQ3KRF3_9PSEU|nr:hypothetical protein [Amycolatopsis bullii]GHG46535.1 hypothetical protein GCM10017567_81150 [Amycolatopsis bullii]